MCKLLKAEKYTVYFPTWINTKKAENTLYIFRPGLTLRKTWIHKLGNIQCQLLKDFKY